MISNYNQTSDITGLKNVFVSLVAISTQPVYIINNPEGNNFYAPANFRVYCSRRP